MGRELIFFIFFINKIYSQNFCGVTNYQIKGYSVAYFKLVFNDKTAFYIQEDFKNIGKVEEENKKLSNGNVQRNFTVYSKSDTPAFLYNNLNSFYFNHFYIDESIDIVKENMGKWSWKILPEKKKVGGFICQKARATFRGSNFTAWFTTEIPVPFGPWKAKDLPGLILELYDDNDITHMTATKITIENNKKCNFDYVEKIDFTKAISIPEFLKREKQKEIAYFKKLNAKLPKGSKTFIIASECEDCPKDIKLENFEVEN